MWDEKKDQDEQEEEELESCCSRHLLTAQIPGGPCRRGPCSPSCSESSQGLVSSPGAGVTSHPTRPAGSYLIPTTSHALAILPTPCRLAPEGCSEAPIPFTIPAAPEARAEPQEERAEQLLGACKGLGGEEVPKQPLCSALGGKATSAARPVKLKFPQMLMQASEMARVTLPCRLLPRMSRHEEISSGSY